MSSDYWNFIYFHSPDKNKPTVRILQGHSDVWHIGKESVDMRLKKPVFVRVQKYFPECSIIVEDLEATVQEAEEKMFPRKKDDQDAWMKTVVQSVLPNVSLWCWAWQRIKPGSMLVLPVLD